LEWYIWCVLLHEGEPCSLVDSPFISKIEPLASSYLNRRTGLTGVVAEASSLTALGGLRPNGRYGQF
jgi:hypothetical protein